ncbi:SMP-30/gluconolactonase/LRE family protein [Oceaniglobus trochenteri]|uniref:SMP-30/gluconolactonase/LRE family protein n=1 Tax=Oceaniglobus trochenteri TaxID=2763260 RepID=UPI001CFFB931|nr:SMP-30/gluconolactonase/LRE family protein [Oceaniglobus trochenteri]
MTPELLFEAGLETGEGPLWDARISCLYCVDSTNPALWVFDAGGKVIDRIALPQPIGFAALTDSVDRLVVGLADGLYLLDRTTRRLAHILDPEPGIATNRINDGVVDSDGSLVFGTLHDTYTRPDGAMYHLSPTGGLTCFDRGYIVSNGPFPHPDGRRFLTANSEIHEVYVFDRQEEGVFTNKRLFCDWQVAWGIPDGIVCDTQGGVWIGSWGGAALYRFHADGILDLRIDFPVSQVTKAAFGGPDLSDLYVTTASRGRDRRSEPLAGSLFRVRTPFTGLPAGQAALPLSASGT